MDAKLAVTRSLVGEINQNAHGTRFCYNNYTNSIIERIENYNDFNIFFHKTLCVCIYIEP